MRRFFNGLLLGIILGVAGAWYYAGTYGIPGVRQAERRADAVARQTLESAQGAAERAKLALATRLEALELRADDISAELAQTGTVVRRRARDLGDSVVDTVVDARITVAIKAKLAVDPDLSALGISVDTTAGRVTLAGTVASPELVGRAMALALETPGVREVVAVLQAKRVGAGAAGSGKQDQ
jgi:osmotically-inducible protein OsmY